jgi:hypothetical protein
MAELATIDQLGRTQSPAGAPEFARRSVWCDSEERSPGAQSGALITRVKFSLRRKSSDAMTQVLTNQLFTEWRRVGFEPDHLL